jgi:hypothetical protein
MAQSRFVPYTFGRFPKLPTSSNRHLGVLKPVFM